MIARIPVHPYVARQGRRGCDEPGCGHPPAHDIHTGCVTPKPILQGRHGTGQPASTTFDPVNLVVLVEGQNHLYFRHPSKLADLLTYEGGPVGCLVRSVTVIDQLSGLTSTYRDSEIDYDRR